MDGIANRTQRPSNAAVPIVLGIVTPIAAYRLSQLIGMGEMGPTLLAVAIFVAAGTMAAYRSAMPPWLIALLIYCGVAFGTTFDALVDPVDRNLFPLEILWWWVVGALPVAMGIVLGRAMAKDKQRDESAV
jgi:hypothetical protein